MSYFFIVKYFSYLSTELAVYEKDFYKLCMG